MPCPTPLWTLSALAAWALFSTEVPAQTTTLADKDVKVLGDGVAESCWKISNPSGPSDYFNNDYDGGLIGNSILAVAAMFCETKSGGALSEIGFYGDNLGVDGSGATPDLGAAATRLANPTGLPGTFCTTLVGYDVPDVSITSSGHAVVGLAPNDSAAWLCADTTLPTANRSYFSTDGYSTPAVPFTVNWMLFPAGPVVPGTLTVNGGRSATIEEMDVVTFTLNGNPGISGEAWMLFLSDGVGNPVLAALPFVFFTTGGSGSVSGIYPCNVFVGGPIPFVALWLDLADTKPSGNGKIKVTNQVNLTINENVPGCTGDPFEWGQQDDGILDANVWRVTNPAGSGDWFNTRHGPAISPLGSITTLTGIDVASWDFCGTGPNWAEVGLYPADLAFDPTGGTPATGSPITRVTGTAASMGPAQSDWSYPATFYDTPDVPASSTTDYHAAVKWASGDTCVWLGSDTDGTDDGGNRVPSTTSYFTADGYATPAVQATNLNNMIKIDWQ